MTEVDEIKKLELVKLLGWVMRLSDVDGNRDITYKF